MDNKKSKKFSAIEQCKKLFFFLTQKALYDTYYDLLFGRMTNDQMDFSINKFFNKNSPEPQNFFMENSYHPGDIVIKFPNPDHPDNDKNDQHNSITHREKDTIFKKVVSIINRQ